MSTVKDYRTGRVVGLAGTAALGGFLFGYDSAVINGATSALKSIFDLSDAMLGFVMLVAAALFLIAAIGQAFPFAVVDLMFWRFLGGAGIGVASVMAPMYIAEIAPAQIRGRMGALQQFAIVIGIFATSLVNYVVLQAAGGNARNEWLLGLEAWQWMFLSMIIPAVIYALLVLRLPESPRYLVAIGDPAKASRVLATIYTVDPAPIVKDIEISLSGDHKPRFSDLRGRSLGLMPIVWIGILLSVFQQFVGINAVFYYSNTIWESVGFSESQAFQTSLITTAINVIFTIVAIALVDRVGRKPLLLVGSAGMVLTLATLTYVFGTAPVNSDGQPVLADGPDVVALISFNLYVAFFAATWGPVVWVLLGEMFPNRIRAAALAVAASAQWMANFVVTTTFPELAGTSLGLAYGIFTVFAVLSIPFVMKYIRETKGVTLENMSKLEGAAAA